MRNLSYCRFGRYQLMYASLHFELHRTEIPPALSSAASLDLDATVFGHGFGAASFTTANAPPGPLTYTAVI